MLLENDQRQGGVIRPDTNPTQVDYFSITEHSEVIYSSYTAEFFH